MFCANCGKKVEDGSKFCEFCGAPLDNKAAQQNTVYEKQPYKGSAENQEADGSHQQKPAPQTKGSSWKKFLTRTITAAVIASGVFFLKGFLGEDPLEPVQQPPQQQVTEQQIAESHPEAAVAKQKTRPMAVKSLSQKLEATAAAQENKKLASVVPERRPRTGQGSTQNAAPKKSQAQVAVQNSSEPRLEDFRWYGDVIKDGFWKDGQKLEYHQCTGSWKGMAVYLQDGTTYVGKATYYVTLSGRMADAKLVMQGHKFYYEGEQPVSEDDTRYVFSGGYDPKADVILLKNKQYGLIGLGPFVERNGKQYAWCRYYTANNVKADLLLVRP